MNSSQQDKSASEQIDAILAKYPDWRGEKMAQLRTLIKEADPDVVEEVKWKKPSNPGGIPVWSHDGILCMGETYKKHLRITFAKGPSLADPKGLFNACRALITGVICGVRLEEIEEPTMREIRYLDKLIDELAKGRPMEKILRK